MSQTKNVLKRMMHLSLLASVGFAALLYGASPSLAAGGVAPPLGLAYGYAVLGTNPIPTTGTVTCKDDGPGGTINGNVGTTGTSITNAGAPCIINGSIDISLPLSGAGAVTDFHSAYSAIDALNPDSQCLPMPTVSGPVLPGVYCSAASTTLGAGIILTLNGNASDVWVFKIGNIPSSGALTLTDFQMVMGSGADACNVYWRTAADATMTRSTVMGTILSGGAITETGGSLHGRALATTDVTFTDPSPLTFAGCAAPPTVTVTKVSNFSSGGGGTFNFTGSNGFAPQNITTTTTGVLVVGATQTLTAPGVSTTITESAPPAGYTLASIVCTGLGALGTATQDLGTRTVTLDAAATVAGAAISCIFTNNYIAPPPPGTPPTVTVTKVSVGAVGQFSFTGDNGFANQTITTATSGVGVVGETQTLTAPGVLTTITEGPLPAGYTLTSIVCTGLGAGSFTPDLTERAVTLNPVAGTAIACTFTNVAQGSITINKVAQGGNRTFNFTSTGTGISPTPFSITTVSGNGSQLFSGLAPGSYTVTETVPVGWNLSTLTCTDPTSNSTGDVGTLTATINLAAGESVSCTFTDNLESSSTISVPTLSEWGMIIFMVLVGLMSIYYLRRQKVKA